MRTPGEFFLIKAGELFLEDPRGVLQEDQVTSFLEYSSEFFLRTI
jgi:hypothetical protein